MTKDEALRLALEALEYTGLKWPQVEEAINGIKAALEALAQPEQEPVAWRAWVSKFPQGTGSYWVYVTKPIMKDNVHNQPLYTTPPQRTWVGLTDIDYAGLPLEQVGLVRWAETKLKEKNT